MSWSIKLFKIRGIDIKVHLTFILILIWAAYRWSNTTGAGWQGALFGVIATLLLFVAVTLHELGHSFQAHKYGVNVRDITLMPMGGLAQMDKMPEKPIQELRIALAGPLVNFLLAGLLVGLGALLQVQSILTLEELSKSLGQANWTGLLAYLTSANLIIGLFNLIPAYPMDGGRVLRALLAMRMDYSRATKIAANIGQALALMLGVWGLMTNSYTLVLVAIFVWMGADQESKGVAIKDTLQEIRVHQAMTLAPHALKANDTLQKAVELTLSTAQSDFPVLEWGTNKVIGVLGERELLNGLQKYGGATPVREVMRSSLPRIDSEELVYTALEKMSKNKLRAAPVVDLQGDLAGLLTTADVNEAFRLLSLKLRTAPAAR